MQPSVAQIFQTSLHEVVLSLPTEINVIPGKGVRLHAYETVKIQKQVPAICRDQACIASVSVVGVSAIQKKLSLSPFPLIHILQNQNTFPLKEMLTEKANMNQLQ